MEKMNLSDIEIYIAAALERKVQDPLVLDVRSLTSIADVFIILSGQSNRQVTSIAENIRLNLKKKGILPFSVDGKEKGHWVLMDYGHVVIHIFYEEIRSFYDLEGLWVEAKRLDISHLTGDTAEKNELTEVEEIFIE